MVRSSLAAVMVGATLGSCGITAPPVEEEKEIAAGPARFEGLIVAGSPSDARASGFTECATEGGGYYGFICANLTASILGVRPLRAIARLTYPSDLPHDAERLPENTSYDSITFQFAEPDGYEWAGCDYVPTNPFACVQDQTQPLPTLIRTLNQQGWVGRSTRGGVDFVKANEPLLIAISNHEVHEEFGDWKGSVVQVSVAPMPAEEVSVILSTISAEEQRRQANQTTSDSFIDSMRAPSTR